MPYTPTPEDIAKRQARKAEKAAKKAEQEANGGVPPKNPDAPRILKRQWVDVRPAQDGLQKGGDEREEKGRVKVATWNMLAQTLVRRDLFPGSDCLKFKDRQDMLAEELLAYSPDIICLQEEDRLDQIPFPLDFNGETNLTPDGSSPVGSTSTSTSTPEPTSCSSSNSTPDPASTSSPPKRKYKPIQARGPRKKHGLAIVYDSLRFRQAGGERVVRYDEEFISPAFDAGETEETEGNGEGKTEQSKRDEERKRRGGTRQTKNIGLVLGLEFVGRPGKGVIVGTTHLFWHPQYAYERTRQALLLLRTLHSYRADLGVDWPIIVAGDFNTQPREAVYHLLTHPSTDLREREIGEVDFSRAVHDSLSKVEEGILADRQKAQGVTGETKPDTQEGEGGEEDAEEEDEKEEPASKDQPIPTDRPKGTRHSEPSDGLLTGQELQVLAREILGGRGLRSAYADSDWVVGADEKQGRKGLSFVGRGGEAEFGDNEPGWTSFTPLWRLTLDYLFDFPPPTPAAPRIEPRRVLLPHATKDLEPGLPRKGVCASDHTLLAVEYAFYD